MVKLVPFQKTHANYYFDVNIDSGIYVISIT